jgi:hypothetical protein
MFNVIIDVIIFMYTHDFTFYYSKDYLFHYLSFLTAIGLPDVFMTI